MTLRCDKLTVSFSSGRTSRAVLKDLSFTAELGSVTAVMGKSGAGKTTLLRLLAAQLTPTSGDISWEGQSYASMTPRARENFRRLQVSQIFQDYSLIETLTAAENISLIRQIQGEGVFASRDVVQAALKKFDLQMVANDFPDTLSGGEQQRVAIARCLVSKAQLILADEPTGALDEGMSATVCQALRHLAVAGKCVILVTHDPDVAATADRVIHLVDGRLSDG